MYITADTADTMSRASFLSLPRELRDEIYNLAFISKKPLYLYAREYKSIRKARATTAEWRLNLLNVTASNSLIASEARSVLFDKCPVHVSLFYLASILTRGPDLLWLKVFQFDIRPYLRRVHITVKMRHAPEDKYWGHIQLLLDCPSLQSVIVNVQAANTWKYNPDDSLSCLKEASRDLAERIGTGLSFSIPFSYKWCESYYDHCHRCPDGYGYPWDQMNRAWSGNWADLDQMLKDDMVQFEGLQRPWVPCHICFHSRDSRPTVW